MALNLKGVLTQFFGGVFILPYKSPVYRGCSKQVRGLANAGKIFYFDIEANFLVRTFTHYYTLA